MLWLDRPSATRARTSVSRRVRAVPGVRRRFIEPVRDGGRERGAAGGGGADGGGQVLGWGVLEEVAGGAGLDGGQDVGVGVVRGDDQHARRLRAGGDRAVASAPPMPLPNCRSIRTTSMSPAAARVTASSAVAASATTTRSGSVSSTARSPARTTGWSSARSRRMGRRRSRSALGLGPGGRGEGKLGGQTRCPRPGADATVRVPPRAAMRARMAARPKPPPSTSGPGGCSGSKPRRRRRRRRAMRSPR